MKKRETDNESTTKTGPPAGNKAGEAKGKTARRRLLTALGVTGTAAFLPTAWHKPNVKGLVLPAHAETTPSEEPVSFAGDCDLSLIFEMIPVGVGGCNGGAATSVIPVVSGSIVGEGDLSGIPIDLESELPINGFTQEINVSTITDNNGDYMLTIDGFQTDDGPHIVCANGRMIDPPTTCEEDFPSGGTVTVTASSPSPRLAGTSMCSATFDCDDLQNPMGSLTDRDRTSETFYVEMTPVDAPGTRRS